VVFLSGVLFLLLTLSNIREQVVNAIPDCLKHGTAAGIGLFVAFIGLRNAKMIVAHPATYVGFGRISDPEVLLAATGLVLISILMTRRFSSAILLGIVGITLAGIPLGLSHWPTRFFSLPHPSGTLLQLDLRAAAKIGLGELIFVFLFVDLFDNVGRLSGFAKGAGSCEMGSFHAPAALWWLTPSGRCLARSRALPQLRVTSRVLPGWQPAAYGSGQHRYRGAVSLGYVLRAIGRGDSGLCHGSCARARGSSDVRRRRARSMGPS
jgi:Permease family